MRQRIMASATELNSGYKFNRRIKWPDQQFAFFYICVLEKKHLLFFCDSYFFHWLFVMNLRFCNGIQFLWILSIHLTFII